MSLLSELESKSGSTQKRKRIGRGQGSGWGKQSGKGHKGQKARSGGKTLRGFEGGQMPLIRRIPKFGFTPRNKTAYKVVNLRDLATVDGEFTFENLLAIGAIHKDTKLKILGDGELTKALTIKAHKFSKTAKEAIEKAGGKAELIA
ncbi:MAG: 50S ribosomal protein L15 [Bdellovibrionales bacterium]